MCCPLDPMPSLFIFSLGPVQDFIATAKRCRDLWFGSWLLSELAKAAARAVAVFPGVAPEALIFPHVRALDDLASDTPMSVANKILAQLPDTIDPAAVGASCHQRLRERLHELRDRTFDGIRPRAAQHLQRSLAELQLDDLIEAQWVSVAFDPGGYVEARRAAETLLGSAKQTRLWAPARHGSSAPKSSLDGLRESVIDEHIHGDSTTHARVRHELALDEGERLCGVGMLKRHGHRKDHPDHHRFFSTPHLAALPLLDRMRTDPERLRPLWARYLAALSTEDAWLEETVPARCGHPVIGRHDGQLLFPSRVVERLDHLLPRAQHAALARILPHLHALLEALDQPAEGPQPYIAILVADGDRMGAAIEHQTTAGEHRRLSAALDDFSRGARSLVQSEQIRGELIYAGGDDVLAFVPVHRALACARQLRDSFARALAPFSNDLVTPTLSVGIGICHFIEPMTRSLQVARAAENLAKRERNSLAIIVDKRSGGRTEVTGSWSDNFDERIARIIEWHINDEIPDRLAHHLAELNVLRTAPLHPDADVLAQIYAFEFAQLIKQKRRKRGQDLLHDATTEFLVRAAEDPQLSASLAVAQILARAEQTASPGERA